MDVNEFMHSASTIVFTLAVLLNSFFIYIVSTKGRKNIGSYKYLMISFAVCNILYSSSEFLSKPAVLIHGTSYMAYSNGILSHSTPWGFLLLCFFIAMYGMDTALLALHFIYRYVIVCKPFFKKYFELPYLAFWSIPMILWGLIYGFLTYSCFCATEHFYQYAGGAVREKLRRDIRELSFFCIFTHETTPNGTTIINYGNATALFLITVMMIITFSIMVICGVLTARMLRKTTMSKKMFEIQKQLLKALTVQALIPFALAYMPRFVMFFFRGYGISTTKVRLLSKCLECKICKEYGILEYVQRCRIFSYTPLIITLYTVLDPIAIILFVNHYRLAVVDMVVVPFRRTSVGSTISGVQPMSTRSSIADLHRSTATVFTHSWKRSI